MVEGSTPALVVDAICVLDCVGEVSAQDGLMPLRAGSLAICSSAAPPIVAVSRSAALTRPLTPSAVTPSEELPVEFSGLPGSDSAVGAPGMAPFVLGIAGAPVELGTEKAIPEAETLDCGPLQAPDAPVVPDEVSVETEELTSGTPEAPEVDAVIVATFEGTIIPPPSKAGMAEPCGGPLAQGTGLPVLRS
jgi:hypothetical protein